MNPNIGFLLHSHYLKGVCVASFCCLRSIRRDFAANWTWQSKLRQIKAYGTPPQLLLTTTQAFSCAQLLLFFREFEGSIQRYQWFFIELPEMLCESEMEVEQHTCWSGQDVVERSVCIAICFILWQMLFYNYDVPKNRQNLSTCFQVTL